MRRGCISLGQVKCDDCQSLIPHPERYLAIDREDGTTERLCVDCALKRGYARNKMERGELVLTFMEEGVEEKGEEKAEAEGKEEAEEEEEKE
jgi:sulfur relay (sulfurtransferase) complex TusBCD TusD component (DsrE family)